MKKLCCGILALLLSACMKPPLELKQEGGEVLVRLETLGEYPTSIRRIRLSEVTSGSIIWEIEARTRIPQIWQIRLLAGENSATIEEKDEYTVVRPPSARKFHLDPDKVYRIEVWGRRGPFPAEATFRLHHAGIQPSRRSGIESDGGLPAG